MPVYKVISCEIPNPALLTAESVVPLWREQGVEQEKKTSEPMPGQNSMPMGRQVILLLPPPLEPAQKGLLTMFMGRRMRLCCIHGLESIFGPMGRESTRKSELLKDLYTMVKKRMPRGR